MSWSYPMGYLDPTQYMNGMQTLCQPFYPN